jgi:hypothetical protein
MDPSLSVPGSSLWLDSLEDVRRMSRKYDGHNPILAK